MNKWAKTEGPCVSSGLEGQSVHGRLREWITFFDMDGGHLQASGGLGKSQVTKMLSANMRISFTLKEGGSAIWIRELHLKLTTCM